MAVSGQEAVRPDDFELHGHLQHVHLLIVDDGERDVIPNSMQLVAGRKRVRNSIKESLEWELTGKIVIMQLL